MADAARIRTDAGSIRHDPARDAYPNFRNKPPRGRNASWRDFKFPVRTLKHITKQGQGSNGPRMLEAATSVGVSHLMKLSICLCPFTLLLFREIRDADFRKGESEHRERFAPQTGPLPSGEVGLLCSVASPSIFRALFRNARHSLARRLCCFLQSSSEVECESAIHPTPPLLRGGRDGSLARL